MVARPVAATYQAADHHASEPAPVQPLTPTERYGRRHPAVRFRKLDAPPDLSKVCLVEHFRTHLHLRNGRLRQFLAALCMLAETRGCAHQFQRTYAKKHRVTDRTIRAWLLTLRELGLVLVELTGPHEAHVYPNWEALGLRESSPEVTEETSGLPSGLPSGLSIDRIERSDRSQPQNAPERPESDAPTDDLEPTVIVDPDDARIAELDRPEPGTALALRPAVTALTRPRPTERPQELGKGLSGQVAAFVAHPRLLARIVERHGHDVPDQIAERLACEPHRRRARNVEHVRRAMIRLACLRREDVTQDAISAFLSYLKLASLGKLSLPKSDAMGGDVMTQLARKVDDAGQRGDPDKANDLKLAQFEYGQRTREQARALEQLVPIMPGPVSDQLSPVARDAVRNSAPRKLPPPTEPPPMSARELLAFGRKPALALPPPSQSLAERLALAKRRLTEPLMPTMRMHVERDVRSLSEQLAAENAAKDPDT